MTLRELYEILDALQSHGYGDDEVKISVLTLESEVITSEVRGVCIGGGHIVITENHYDETV